MVTFYAAVPVVMVVVKVANSVELFDVMVVDLVVSVDDVGGEVVDVEVDSSVEVVTVSLTVS